ncbi:hypothetical protein UFOVP248_70 [uncultured Caudovirales phage]|uniref:Uncharacterized protein n=1 Tax=uncultured Caudovirales phage TaxID=2100421 RepID=A0A6J5LLT8_9CAUD|nr:hypothetical protein UFOVP248_70 [uncultured Caudovirales phage]
MNTTMAGLSIRSIIRVYRQALSKIHKITNKYNNYHAEDLLSIDEPSYYLAESLIHSLRNSNGLEQMPEEQRMALIFELSKPCTYTLEEE